MLQLEVVKMANFAKAISLVERQSDGQLQLAETYNTTYVIRACLMLTYHNHKLRFLLLTSCYCISHAHGEISQWQNLWENISDQNEPKEHYKKTSYTHCITRALYMSDVGVEHKATHRHAEENPKNLHKHIPALCTQILNKARCAR